MNGQPAILTRRLKVDTPLIIDCPACDKSVAAMESMVGQTVECPFCAHHFKVQRAKTTVLIPQVAIRTTTKDPAKDPALIQAEMANYERQLRENTTQITELRGHVSRLNMDLHRHELRMKTLSDRQTELNTQIAAAKASLEA